MKFALAVRRENVAQAVARLDTLVEATDAMDVRRREGAGPEPYVLQVRELLPNQAVIDGRIVADSVVVPRGFPMLDRATAQALADAAVSVAEHLRASVVDMEGGAVIEFHWGETSSSLGTLYGREHFLAEADRHRRGADDPGGGRDRLFRRVTWTGDVAPLVRDLKRRMNAILKEWE